MKERPGATRTELVPAGAATLWTQTSGQGRPLVLCHGGPGMSDNLEPPAQMVHWGHRRWRVGGHSWGAMLALCYTLAHSDRVTGLLYLSGPGLDATATTRDRVRAARLARLTEAERARLLAAEHRLSDNGDDEDAAATVARLLWLTDFADRSSAPDVTAEPRFAYPRNAEAAAALNQDRVRGWPTRPCADGSASWRFPPWSSTAHATPSPPTAPPPSLPSCSAPHAWRSCPGWAIRRGSKTPRWSVRRYGASQRRANG